MTDRQLVRFAAGFREGILDGGPSDMMCAAVCWPLVTLLNMHGVKCEATESRGIETSFGTSNHIWIRLADGRALDPTADQFSSKARQYPPIYLGEPTEIHRDRDGSREAGETRSKARPEGQEPGPKASPTPSRNPPPTDGDR